MTHSRERAITPAGELALREIYATGDRLMGRFLWFHTLLALAMAPAYGTWLVSLSVAPLALSMFLVARRLSPGRFITRASAGIALQTFCALHIYQYHGLAEQHFWFFTATTAMIIYKDPRALWPGILLIIGQHILFASLHNAGVTLFFFDVAYVGSMKLVFHFGIALVQAALAAYIAGALRTRTIAEAELRAEVQSARETAERAVLARSTFLATMSHEIRTPMNGVEGMADVLLAGELNDDQMECAETIRASSRALLSIIGDVLDFSKIESGKLDIVMGTYRPAAISQDVARLLRPAAEEGSVTLEVHVGEGVPASVCGDGPRVRQVLVNLMGNGVKFAANGTVGLTIEDSSNGRLTFSVRDDGIGVDKEAAARVFEPFEQASSETSVRFGGTGLGLAITRRLVEAMGGDITMESAPGEGTVVRVELPAEPVDEIAPREVLDEAASPRDLSVLVAEDNAVNRRVAARLLALLDCEASFAVDGEDALLQLREGRFDLVLMDCQMPVMDGWTAASRWRDEEATRGLEAIPIIALTASTLARDHERAAECGMQSVLTKPVGLAELKAALVAHAPEACAPE